MKNIKVLIVTSEWPSFPGDIAGIHVFDQADQLRAAGIDVEVFAFRGRKNLIRYAKAIIDFLRLDRKHFDVIHAHHGQSGVVALSQRTQPVVVTFHGSDLQGIRDMSGHITLQGRILQFLCRIIARFADDIILVSNHLKVYIPARTYQVIPAGIDLNLFRPIPSLQARAKLNLPENRYLVLFVGDPERTEKRFRLAHESIERLKNQLNVELVVANGVLREMMPYYMNACDVLLVTSFHEGSPSVVKEALACNLPVVSTDVGDVRERIGEIGGCVLCANDRPETIATALRQSLSRDKRIDGRTTVLDLDERVLAQKVIEVYQRTLEKQANDTRD